MAKWSLILMLMTTQLLAGSCDSIYLCIGSDGTYRIDGGPDACSTCQVTCEASCTACSGVERLGDSPCSTHLGERNCRSAVEKLEESCDCTHIPVVLSSDQPARTVRSSVAVELELSSLVVQPPAIGLIYLPVLSSRLCSDCTSAIPSFSLTVVSTVVIRC